MRAHVSSHIRMRPNRKCSATHIHIHIHNRTSTQQPRSSPRDTHTLPTFGCGRGLQLSHHVRQLKWCCRRGPAVGVWDGGWCSCGMGGGGVGGSTLLWFVVVAPTNVALERWVSRSWDYRLTLRASACAPNRFELWLDLGNLVYPPICGQSWSAQQRDCCKMVHR